MVLNESEYVYLLNFKPFYIFTSLFLLNFYLEGTGLLDLDAEI